MDNRWRLKRAVAAVNELRVLLRSYGCILDVAESVDPAGIAEAYLGCQIILLDDLTDRRAMEHLATDWKIDISDEVLSNEPLSGGLYVAEGGSHRWIFVERTEHPRRRRFTIGHEIGHLMQHALPHLAKEACSLGPLLSDGTSSRLLKYGRCTLTRLGPLTTTDKRELDAQDYAAELLMPRDGVIALLRENFKNGFRAPEEIAAFANLLASTYEVSLPAAERHVSNFSFQIIDQDPNRDLFAF